MEKIFSQIPLSRFLSTRDGMCGTGTSLGENSFEPSYGKERFVHSCFDGSEADRYLDYTEPVFKESRLAERVFEGERIRQGFIDYIVGKNNGR